jgi:lysophospholipase L1-like esterase
VTGANAAFGIKRLSAGYAGPYVKAYKVTGATEQDIAFDANGPDVSSLASFLGASLGSVTTLYDQSGSGNDGAQATANNKPAIDPASGVPVWDHWRAGGNTTARVLNLPSGYSADKRAFSSLHVLELPSVDVTGYVLALSGISLVVIASNGIVQVFSGSAKSTTLRVPSSKFALLTRHHAGGVDVYLNTVESKQTLAANTAGTITTGGSLGSGSITTKMRLHETVTWPRSLSDSEAATALEIAVANHGIEVAPAFNVVVDGDSISEGVGATLGRNWPYRLGLPASRRLVNFAVTGQRMDQMAADVAEVTPLLSASSYLLVWGGTNDLSTTDTGAQIYSELTTYVNAAVAAGQELSRIAVFTLNTAGLGNGGTARDDFNALVRANALGVGHIIDVAADPQLGVVTGAGTHNNPSLWIDGPHMTDAGYQMVADMVNAAIPALKA